MAVSKQCADGADERELRGSSCGSVNSLALLLSFVHLFVKTRANDQWMHRTRHKHFLITHQATLFYLPFDTSIQHILHFNPPILSSSPQAKSSGIRGSRVSSVGLPRMVPPRASTRGPPPRPSWRLWLWRAAVSAWGTWRSIAGEPTRGNA